jgi:hypothetical protein
VLDAVTLVLERRAEPMRVRDVHREVESEFDEVVPFSSVNETLSTHASCERSRLTARKGAGPPQGATALPSQA